MHVLRYLAPAALVVVALAATSVWRGASGDAVDPVPPAWTAALPDPVSNPSFQQGVALGLFFEAPGGTYASYLWEAARSGASHVSIVTRLAMHDVRATEVRATPSLTASDDELRGVIQAAHALGLEVMLFPIVWLEERGPGEWRGRIDTDDVDAWFASYGRHVEALATIAAEEGVEIFCVGSELGSLERHSEHWTQLIARVRERYDGSLIYSANWDHFHRTPFWGLVDYIGVTGYYELAPRTGEIPDVDGLVAAWQPVIDDLAALAAANERPVVITEVGYVSQPDAARYPWNYTLTGDVDLRAQRDLYEAMMRALDGQPDWLGGVYVWNWFGDGGLDDDGYTPRGKPAEDVVQHWFGGLR